MDDETRERIEKEAVAFATEILGLPPFMMDDIGVTGYIRGATAEHSRITELLKEERIKVIDEIKKHIGHRSYDVDGMPVVIEVQKLQQYLTSIKR